jgi:hypothetical protein
MVVHWRLQVQNIAVVENMCFFEGDGKHYYPKLVKVQMLRYVI